jgi:hypothetical protein
MGLSRMAEDFCELKPMEKLSLWSLGASPWEASCDPTLRRQPPSMPSRYAALGLAHAAPHDSITFTKMHTFYM